MNTLSKPERLQDIVRLAAQEELLPRFEKVGHKIKADGSILTEADLAMDQRLKSELSSLWPETGFLSEEMTVDEQENLLRNPRQPLWCLDPLDGTSNFAAGIPLFGVSLALISDGKPLISVIYDPIKDECFYAESGRGVWLNKQRLIPNKHARPLKQSIAMIDLKRLPAQLATHLITQPPYGSQRNFGSCALEWCWLAAGRGHLSLHGGQKLWDYAAGVLILEEAGGYSCTLQAEPVFKPVLSPRSVIASLDEDLWRAWKLWINEQR